MLCDYPGRYPNRPVGNCDNSASNPLTGFWNRERSIELQAEYRVHFYNR